MEIALVINDKIKQIVVVDSLEEITDLSRKYQATIEIDNLTPKPQVGWILQEGELVSPIGEVARMIISKKISKLALLNRFTNAELGAYYVAIDNNLGLKVLDKKLFAAEFIDLTRPDTILGINTLVAAHVITAERALQILNTEPTDIEIYRGK